jgi:hypothetical protein
MRFNFNSAMAGDQHHLPSLQLGCRVHHMLHQRSPRQTVQNLGQSALHAGTFARGHNDNIHGTLSCAYV